MASRGARAAGAAGYWILNSYSSDAFAQYIPAGFHQGLKQAGYIEGRNVAIEYRWANGHYDRLLKLARSCSLPGWHWAAELPTGNFCRAWFSNYLPD